MRDASIAACPAGVSATYIARIHARFFDDTPWKARRARRDGEPAAMIKTTPRVGQRTDEMKTLRLRDDNRKKKRPVAAVFDRERP